MNKETLQQEKSKSKLILSRGNCKEGAPTKIWVEMGIPVGDRCPTIAVMQSTSTNASYLRF